MEHNTSSTKAWLVAALLTGASATFSVVFVEYLWPRLPPWLSVVVYVFIAAAVIGHPIYALARWSDRRLLRPDDAAQQDKSR